MEPVDERSGALGSVLALIFLLEVAVLAMVGLARYYTATRTGPDRRRWLTRWEVTPESLGG